MSDRLASICRYGLLLVLFAGLGYFIASQTQIGTPPGGIGVADFRYYYAAFHTAATGLNPYSLVDINLVAEQIGISDPEVSVAFVYPPWLLLLLHPLFLFPFKIAASIWFVGNLFLIWLCGLVSWKLFSPNPPKPLVVALASVFFFPVVQVLHYGSLSLFIAATFLAGVYYLTLNRVWIAGFLFSIALLKPQMTYLGFVALLLWGIRERTLRWIGTTITAMAVSMALTFLLFPSIDPVAQGLDYITHRATDLKYASFAVFLRACLLISTGHSYPNIQWILLIGAVLAYIAWFYLKGRKTPLAELLPTALCLSILFSPYIWLYDHVILLVVQVGAIALSFRPGVTTQTTVIVVLGFAALQLIAVLASALLFELQIQFFWYPAAVWLLWALCFKLLKPL